MGPFLESSSVICSTSFRRIVGLTKLDWCSAEPAKVCFVSMSYDVYILNSEKVRQSQSPLAYFFSIAKMGSIDSQQHTQLSVTIVGAGIDFGPVA